jgi:hypothetical protein
MKLWASACTAAAIGWAVKLAIPAVPPVLMAVLVLGPYGLVFFGAALALQIPEASTAFRRLIRPRR